MTKRVALPPEVTQIDHGASALRVDRVLSLEVAEEVDAQQHGCYLAAWRTVIGEVLEDAVYVEGYALHPDLPVPVAHAWVEWGEESLIDPVYVRYSPNGGRRYFPGIRLTGEQMALLDEAYPDGFLPYSDFCRDHPDLHTAVREAYYAANEALAPGLGAQLRQLDTEVQAHNRGLLQHGRPTSSED